MQLEKLDNSQTIVYFNSGLFSNQLCEKKLDSLVACVHFLDKKHNE